MLLGSCPRTHPPLPNTYWDTFLYPGIVQRGLLEAADLGQTNRQFYNTSLFFPRQQPATVIPPFIVPTTCTMQPSSTTRWQAFQARRSLVAWGEALVHCILESYTFCAAHPTPSFIPSPLNPYNRLLAEVLVEKDEDLEDAEMEDRETEDGGGVKHL